nr:hypothetical protein [Tanacetum cinerariifolium]
MCTRFNFYPFNSTATIPRRSNRRRIPNIVEPEIRTIAEIVPMADRTMEELLQAPTEGYGEAKVTPKILAKFFEIKTNLLRDVSNDAIKLMLFPYSLEGAARVCNQSTVCAATGSYNQVSPPNRASHQISPPGFAPVQNNPNSIFAFSSSFARFAGFRAFPSAFERFCQLSRVFFSFREYT